MKSTIFFKRSFICLATSVSIILTAGKLQAQPTQLSNKLPASHFHYKVTDAPHNTYGYDIYAGNKMMIHQPSVPAIAGKKGFITKSAAAKVAQLVITKIKKGESLPAVSINEMKELKAIK